MGELHGSPEARLARPKCRLAPGGDSEAATTGVCSTIDGDVEAGDLRAFRSALQDSAEFQLRSVAELAQVCREACHDSKLEGGWEEEQSVHGQSNRENATQTARRKDRVRLELSTGHEYLRGALIRIACHLGLSGESRRIRKGHRQEEGNLLAVAALEYLVS